MSKNRYLRLIPIDLGIAVFCVGLLLLGLGLWISIFYVQVSGAVVSLFNVFLADSLFIVVGTVSIIVSVKTIANARKEYRKIITRN